jgi:hypothetical protein
MALAPKTDRGDSPVRRINLLATALLLLLPACSPKGDGSARAVESYLNALVAKNGDQLSALSCADWESSALTELDSFQAVDVRLEGLDCATTGSDGDTTLVTCQGRLIASYGNEDQELDLSTRTYRVIEQGGYWLVCGAQ